MNYKITEKLFEKNGVTDSKHILNTSGQAVPESVLNEIEKGGVSLERLNEFNRQGLDIYKYQTQITIHGIFPELGCSYLHGYKLLFQNKNKSIGVKWLAIDAAKKKKIYDVLGYYGWGCVKNSQAWYLYKMKQVKTKEDASEAVNKFRDELKNLDTCLFYGNSGIYMAKSMFGVFVVSELVINAISEKNVNKVIEQIAGKDSEAVYLEVEKIKADREEKWRKEREERDERWRRKEEEEKRIKMEFLEKNGYPDGFKDYEIINIIDGLQTAYVYLNSKNEPEWRFDTYTRSSREKKFRKNGEKTSLERLRKVIAKYP